MTLETLLTIIDDYQYLELDEYKSGIVAGKPMTWPESLIAHSITRDFMEQYKPYKRRKVANIHSYAGSSFGSTGLRIILREAAK